MNHVIIAKFIDRLGQQEPSEELNFTQESRNQENPQTFSCLPETHAAAARRAKNLSLTVGRGDGELLGDGEVGEEHEEEPQQEPDAEVLLRRACRCPRDTVTNYADMGGEPSENSSMDQFLGDAMVCFMGCACCPASRGRTWPNANSISLVMATSKNYN